METRTPFVSSSSVVPPQRSGIRRRSGGLTSNDGHSSSSAIYSPSFHLQRHLKPVPYFHEDDPYLPSSTEDVNVIHDSRRPSGLLAAVENAKASLPVSPTETRNIKALGSYDRPLPSLPPSLSPDTVAQENNIVHQPSPFASIPLTPRPDGPSRLDSYGSEASKASKRSVFSIFPRLPTPDFSALKIKPFHHSILAPLSLLRPQTPSISSNTSVSSPLSRVRTSSTESIVTARNAGYCSGSSIPAEACTGHKIQAESFQSGHTSQRSDTLYGDDSYSSFMAKAPLRFTRKFPSPVTAGIRKSLSDMDAFERLMALDLGDGLGVERIGRWTIYKWCLLLSVVTVNMKQTSTKTLATNNYDLGFWVCNGWFGLVHISLVWK